MVKNFKTKDPLKNFLPVKQEDLKQINEVKEHKEVSKSNTKLDTKRKVGRPRTRTEDTKTINIAVPISTLEKMEIAKNCYGKNLTKYINTLISKDLELNYTNYKDMYDKLKSLDML